MEKKRGLFSTHPVSAAAAASAVFDTTAFGIVLYASVAPPMERHLTPHTSLFAGPFSFFLLVDVILIPPSMIIKLSQNHWNISYIHKICNAALLVCTAPPHLVTVISAAIISI